MMKFDRDSRECQRSIAEGGFTKGLPSKPILIKVDSLNKKRNGMVSKNNLTHLYDHAVA